MKLIFKTIATLSLTSLMTLTAQAHVTIQERTAVQGTYHRAAFKVGHGCEGSPTVKVVIDLPEGLVGAKPMPKAGWQISTETRPLAKPYDSHGKAVTERVARVTWSGGSLPDAHYDEFVMQFQVKADAGVLWIPVDQICEKGRNPWMEVPQTGTETRGLKFPAARFDVLAPAKSEHKHH
jgi:uncharacterized protein YcnI